MAGGTISPPILDSGFLPVLKRAELFVALETLASSALYRTSQQFVSTALQDGLPKKHLRDDSNVFTISGFGARRSVLKRILIVAGHRVLSATIRNLLGQLVAVSSAVITTDRHYSKRDVDLPFRRPFQPAKGWRPPFCPARRPGG
jgi:hypothetical protein